MSTLDKLSIRGVRSFGTAQRDEQLITFTTPITLILGENGCGKTTIIECLKYALIGELPPGSSKGQSFVHDPKIFNAAESLGQVKLQVRNELGDKVTVCRSMKSSLAKRGAGGLKFETLDSTIHVTIAGKHESVSKRCADTNVEMAHVMGVPKAIINNVLFCHQEDSSWPLEEAKKLKERFDEIFGTTEYNKAIDKLLKHRKAYEARAKEKESELNLLEHLKKDAETRTLDLNTAEEKVTKLEQTMQRCEETMVPIRERLDKIRSIELEITKLYTNKTEVSTKLDKCTQHQTSLAAKIRTTFAGSDADLDRELATFKSTHATHQADLQRHTDDLQAAKSTATRIQQQLGDLDRRRATLVVQRQQEQELADERGQHLASLCRRLEIRDVPGDLQQCDAAQLDDTLRSVRSAFAAKDAALAELAGQHDRADAEAQAELDRLRERRTQLEADVMSANRQAAVLRQEQSRTQQKIEAVEKQAAQLKTLAAEIAKVERCLEDCEAGVDLEADRKRIADAQKQLDELQDEQDVLDVDVSVLTETAAASAELEIKRKALEQRETDCRRLQHKQAGNLKQVLGEVVPEPQQHRRLVQAQCHQLQRELADGQKEIVRAQQRATELQVQRRQQKAEVQKGERELAEAEERVYELCHSEAYGEVVARCKQVVEKLQLDHGALKASQVLYTKYMQKLDAEPCCPLCHTDMSATEVGNLTTEMQDELCRLPERTATAERQLRTEQQRYEKLLSLGAQNERCQALRKEIPALKQRLATTEKDLDAASASAEDLQIKLIQPTERLDLAQSMMGDMSLTDEAQRDAEQLRQQVAAIERRLPARSGTQTLAQAQAARSELGRRIRIERTALERLQQDLRATTDKLAQLRERRNQLRSQQIAQQEGVQALDSMRQRQQELDAQIAKHRAEAADHEAKLSPLRAEFTAATAAKEATRQRNRAALAEAQQAVAESRRGEREVQRCGAELQRLAAMRLVEEIEKVRKAIGERQTEQRSAITSAESATARITTLREQLSGAELAERDLLDNRELRGMRAEVAALRAELDELTRDLGDHDFRSVAREKEGLVKQSDAIQMERSECVGQMGELRGRVRTLRAELALPKYADAVRAYLRTYYDSVVLRRMVKDLGTYRVALEWALMNFHTEKMERINQLVKGLWHKIYRGNDIDYIQIRTDEMKVQNVDKRRSYDYRVVQIKNDSELDMRGRCSAGQRVLACLIIRIALAETFSVNCGVLTLDEPTTNLDRVNIVSLCQALNAIVEERRAQSNFMLVVITHDEELITALGRIENYWKVSRGSTGKSIIERVAVE